MGNPVGRPKNPNGLVKTGSDIHVWLSKKDLQKLNVISKLLEIPKAEAIRMLIKSYFLEKQGEFLVLKRQK